MLRAVFLLVLGAWGKKVRHVSIEADASAWDLTAAVPTAEQELLNDAADFVEWFESEGGEFAEGAEMTWSRDHGFHLVARQRIPLYEMLAVTPPELLLRLPMLDESIDDRLDYAQHAQLALLLVRERLRGAASRWAPWFALLPESVPNAPFFTRKDLNLFRGTTCDSIMSTVLGQVGDFIAKAMSRYADHPDFSGLTEEHLRWGFAIALSRSFGAPNEEVFVAPGCDMLNHNEFGFTKWHFPYSMRGIAAQPAKDGELVEISETFRLHTHQGFPGNGEQIFNTYKTGLSNYQLLSNFGFTRDSNSNEHIRVGFAPNPTDRDRAIKNQLRDLAKISVRNTIRLPLTPRSSPTSGVHPNLVKVFRIMMMTSTDIRSIYRQLQILGLDNESGDFNAAMGISFYIDAELDRIVRYELAKHLNIMYTKILKHGSPQHHLAELAKLDQYERDHPDERSEDVHKQRSVRRIAIAEMNIFHNAIASLLHGKIQKDGSIIYDSYHDPSTMDTTLGYDGLILALREHDPSLPRIPDRKHNIREEAAMLVPPPYSNGLTSSGEVV